MAFIVNGREQLNNTDTYFFNPLHHTDGNENKCIWSIDCQAEFKLISDSIKHDFIEPVEKETDTAAHAFNLCRKDNNLQILGYWTKRKDLKIAKFVKSVHSEWHGYPADHISRQQDKPKNQTLKKLSECGVITKREMTLIARGKKL